jgi:hypothetical protein
MQCALTHDRTERGGTLFHFISYQQSKRQPEKPVESTAKLDSRAASGSPLFVINAFKIDSVSAESKTC